MKYTIQVQNGQPFDFLNVDASGLTIDVIAHSLSNLCRFTGHTREFYSVAQHSVYVSYVVPPEDAFAGLMHDAAEALLGDVASPLKALLPDYRAIEDRVEATLFAHFGLSPKLPDSVKHADRLVLSIEQRDLMPTGELWESTKGFSLPQEKIVPLGSSVAKMMFLSRYEDLRKQGLLPKTN